MAESADRNLLIGILAVQLDFINRDQLIAAMNAWVLEKSRPLDEFLLEQDALSDDTHGLLIALVGCYCGQPNARMRPSQFTSAGST